MQDPTAIGGGVRHSTESMLTYHSGALPGSPAKPATSATGRRITVSVSTSTSLATSTTSSTGIFPRGGGNGALARARESLPIWIARPALSSPTNAWRSAPWVRRTRRRSGLVPGSRNDGGHPLRREGVDHDLPQLTAVGARGELGPPAGLVDRMGERFHGVQARGQLQHGQVP